MARSGGAVFRSALRHLIALLCVITAFSLPNQSPWWHPNQEMYFKVSSWQHDEYTIFQDVHHRRIARKAKGDIEEDLILPLQRPFRKPECWNTITLVGLGAYVTRLAIRIDNLDLAGFANQKGRWHAFRGKEKLITNSVPLGFDDDYHDLTGGHNHKYVHNIQLGRDAMLEAVRVLSEYDSSTGDEAELKRALLVIVISICEAARFPEIREHIRAGWWTGTYLTDDQEKYLVSWQDISCAILIYEKEGSWTSDEARLIAKTLKIYSYAEALAKVDLILQAKTCKSEVREFK